MPPCIIIQMQDFDVIITCSGLGSRLSPITNYMNKALIKIGDEAIISKIINSYPVGTRFIITLGYLKEQVLNYIDICHKNANVQFVEIDDYSSGEASLLYSLSKTFNLIDKPFYYNACDTYVELFNGFENNTALISKTFIGNQYRKVDENIKDVPAEVGEMCYTGVCYIKDIDEFKKITKELLKTKSNQLSDAHVIQKMNVDFFVTQSWNDIGNFISLDHTNSRFDNKICVLNKDNQETYLCDNKIIKFFSDKNKVKKLYKRHLELKKCVPTCGTKDQFIYYDFVPGETLSYVLTNDLLNSFLDWCEKNLWIKSDYVNNNFFDDFYVAKAKERVDMFLNKHDHTLTCPQEINFRKVDDIYDLLDSIPNDFKNKSIFCITHGDLVFENVIFTKDGFKLIDWREGFITNIGDKLYDIAKMKHNLIFDHNIIKKEKYFLKTEDDFCLFDPCISDKNVNLIKELNDWCKKNNIDVKLIDLIVALIQISSSGVHVGKEAYLLFYMGWYNLNKVLKNE